MATRPSKKTRAAQAPLPEEPSLNGAQRAALFLLSLPEHQTAEVFSHLEPNEIKRIMAAMPTLTKVSRSVATRVFEDFAHFAHYEPVMLEGGAQYLRGALNRALGTEQAQFLLGEVQPEEGPGELSLAQIDPRTLANVLEVEHPQTIALLMTSMEAKQAAAALACMPESVQDQIMSRLARLERVSPHVVAEIENSILSELQGIGPTEQKSIKGSEQAAALLNNMERSIGVEILSRLEEVDEELAGNIRSSMFTFEDLMGVDERGTQAILKEISSDVLLLSLKTASPDLQEKFFRNMSSRAAEMMRDDLAAMGPVRVADVEQAQKEIAQIALRLQEEGTIVIAGAGDDVV